MSDREYRFIDPDDIDTTDVGPILGTNAQCLADALLDIIQVSLASGMTNQDVEEAMTKVIAGRAALMRPKFKLHIKEKEKEEEPGT